MKPLQPDKAYQKTSMELDQFERASFSALLGGVPNFYRNGRDDTAWGRQLRGVSKLFAQADFQNQYITAGANPAWLNPADLLREYSTLIGLNRNYPGTTQYDLDFKDMVLQLLAAYRLGATPECIRKVLVAYTGNRNLQVTELFKQIGSFYDVSYRHAVSLLVPVGKNTGLSSAITTDVARVRDIVQDLYTALDLAKPAHVGLDLTTVLPDNVDPVVLTLTDSLRIYMLEVEAEPGDPMLWQGPMLDPATPDTGLGPMHLDLNYQWMVQVGAATPVRIIGATNPDLILPNVTLGDTGNRYFCRVYDPNFGTVISDAAVLSVYPTGLAVKPRPTSAIPSTVAPVGQLFVKSQPYSLSLFEGAQAVFSVTAMNKVQPGLLSPHINRVWEIKDDKLISLDPD
jgi:hypothetical protein